MLLNKAFTFVVLLLELLCNTDMNADVLGVNNLTKLIKENFI